MHIGKEGDLPEFTSYIIGTPISRRKCRGFSMLEASGKKGYTSICSEDSKDFSWGSGDRSINGRLSAVSNLEPRARLRLDYVSI
jgi:hypothetical protein